MAIITVKQLMDTLQSNYDPEQTLVITWWDKSDVEMYFGDDIEEGTEEQVWDATNEALENALEYFISGANDEWSDAVYKHLGL